MRKLARGDGSGTSKWEAFDLQEHFIVENAG
jgi:hypothetical protein